MCSGSAGAASSSGTLIASGALISSDLISSSRTRARGSMASATRREDVEAHEDTLLVGEVADDLRDRLRQPAHQRRDGQDLVARGELRGAEQVDHLDAVLAREVGLADAAQLRERGHGLRGLSRDVEPELER